MRQKLLLTLALLALFTVFVVACGTSPTLGAVEAVQEYWNALVAKDDAALSLLSCADWEASALLYLDSFQAVDIRLEDFSCAQTGTEGEVSLVVCQGRLVKTYDNEDQEIDLSLRIYEVIQQGGEFLVCGIR